jgi:hypothetical protein
MTSSNVKPHEGIRAAAGEAIPNPSKKKIILQSLIYATLFNFL